MIVNEFAKMVVAVEPSDIVKYTRNVEVGLVRSRCLGFLGPQWYGKRGGLVLFMSMVRCALEARAKEMVVSKEDRDGKQLDL
jgi:hypothetical protein